MPGPYSGEADLAAIMCSGLLPLAVAASLPNLRGKPARIVWGAADQFQKIEHRVRFARDIGAPLISHTGRQTFHAGRSSG